MKKTLTFLAMLTLSSALTNAQDISVNIPKDYIQNYFNALIDSRALTFSKINGDYNDLEPDFSFVVNSLESLTFNSNGTINLRMSGRLQMVVNFAPDVDESIDVFMENASLTSVVNDFGETFLRLSFNPHIDFSTVNSVSGNLYSFLGTIVLIQYLTFNPQALATSPFIDIPASIKYFSSIDPAVVDPNIRLIQITPEAIKINLVLKEGPRFVRVANEVNGKQNVGSIEREVNSVWQQHLSPKVFEINAGTQVKLGTTHDLLDETNGKNKYKQWILRETQTPLNEFSIRKIQTTIPTIDPTYLAKFEKANRVQFQSFVDGASLGNLMVKNIAVGQNYDQYDFNILNVQHSLTSNLDGLNFSGTFLNWSDGNLNQTRTYVVNQDLNISGQTAARRASRYPDWVSGKKFASAENIDGLLYEKKWKNGASEERELWLHIGQILSNEKEIKVAGQSENFRAYSVVKNQSYYAVLYVNGSNQLKFKLYNSTGVLSRNETLNTIGSTVVPHLLTEVMSYPNCPPYVDPDECFMSLTHTRLGIVWKEGTTVSYRVLDVSHPTSFSWSPQVNNLWSNYLNSATILQVATGNNMGTGSWIYYVYNGNVYAVPFRQGHIGNPSVQYAASGNPFTSVSGAVGEFGKLHLLISRNIPNYAYQIGLGTRDYNGNSTPYNVREYTYASVGSHAYTAGGLSVAGDQILAQPGKYMYYRNVYDKWYFNGTNWNATNWASPASEWTPKPMLNQYTVDFVTTTAEGEFHKLNASHQSPMAKSSGGMLADRDPSFNQYLTVVGLTKGDTLATYADILPQFVDSIRIDTLGTWYIVLHQMQQASALKSSLDLMGQSWLSTDSIRTVYFQPDTANFIHFLLDPTGEKARKVAGSGSDTEEEEIAVPKGITISAFPNPFNPSTNFKFSLPEKEMVSLKVYNLLGQEVETLVNRELSAGDYQVPFNGSHLSTGTYLYKLVVGDKVLSGKINLVK